MVWLIRWVVRVVAALLAFLLFETGVAVIPDSIASQYAFLASLNEEWLIRLAALVLGFFLALVAIGPYRVQAWIKWASPDHSTSTAVPLTAETASAAGEYREPVGETYRDPSLGPEVKNLLRRLEEHGLYRPEALKSYERQAVAKPLSLYAIERIANLLNEIGYDW